MLQFTTMDYSWNSKTIFILSVLKSSRCILQAEIIIVHFIFNIAFDTVKKLLNLFEKSHVWNFSSTRIYSALFKYIDYHVYIYICWWYANLWPFKFKAVDPTNMLHKLNLFIAGIRLLSNELKLNNSESFLIITSPHAILDLANLHLKMHPWMIMQLKKVRNLGRMFDSSFYGRPGYKHLYGVLFFI